MDFLFSGDRNPWVFMDNEATKVGAIFDRDMEHGEALTAFDEKTLKTGHVENLDYEHLGQSGESKNVPVGPQETA